MKPIFKNTGGIRVGRDIFPEWSLTSPFVTLELFNEKIVFTINVEKRYLHIYLFAKMFKLNQQFEIPLSEIDYIKRVYYFPILADGIRIYHHANAPKYIIYWSLFSTKKIINLLVQKGVKEEVGNGIFSGL